MSDILPYAVLSIPLIGAFSMFALGIVLIYRASRVLNLAHGAMAMLPAFIYYTAVKDFGLPWWVALPASVAAGAGLGVAVEAVFVRRLRAQGPTAQTVGTVAVTGLLIALASRIWGTTPRIPEAIFPAGEISLGEVSIAYGNLGVFFTGVAVSISLFAFFRFTEVGLAMRGAAQNRKAAALMGIDPDLAASGAWAMGGAMAALAGILLASVTSLEPFSLSLQVLPGFVAALIGGLSSLPGALAGAAVTGLAFGLVPALSSQPVVGQVLRYQGSPQLVLTVLAMVVMAIRGRRFASAGESESGLVTSARPFASLKNRRLPRSLILLGVVALAWPFVVPFSVLGTTLLAAELALVAISIVVLTGWVGQISLAQASFVGISALVTGLAVRGWDIGFPVNMLVGAGAAAAIATLLGVVALRVRGLYLAVATLIFAWMSDRFLIVSPWLGAHTGTSTIPGQVLGMPGGYPSFDFTKRKTLYFVLLAVLVLIVFVLSNLRDTKTGRAFFAVRGSETAAVSLGIDVTRYKLIAFALAGGLAGVGGNLLMIEQGTVVPAQFVFTESLFFLAVAVVGGLGSLGGAVSAGVLFAALSEVFFRVPAIAGWRDVVSVGLLAVVLLAYPGGLAAIPHGLSALLSPNLGRSRAWVRATFLPRRRRPKAKPAELSAKVRGGSRARLFGLKPGVKGGKGLLSALAPIGKALTAPVARLGGRRMKGVPVDSGDWFRTAVSTQPPQGSSEFPPDGKVPLDELRLETLASGRPELADSGRSPGPALIEATGVTVRFGGLTAVDNASLELREGEIVGLIGPNGAGKTTLFNAILGLNNPVSGAIKLYGRDVSRMPPHFRARIGLARTFQVIQLFNELSVFDNLLVATHLHNRSGFFSNLAASPVTLKAEAEVRERVRAVLSLLELEDLAGQGVKGQPFGTLRMIELGRALVTGAKVLMLDEPASGLNEAETDRLSHVIAGVRGLGVSVLLIEHDVRMVTGVSDYMYVLDQGRMIARGHPEDIKRDQQVIAAYLGGTAVPVAAAADPVRA